MWVLNFTFIHYSSIVLPVYALPDICVNRLIKRYRVQSIGADDDYYGSVWTACTVLQLSENIGNPWGELTPTLNYRLALTASLFAHQPANPPSHQPSPTLLPHSQSRHPLPPSSEPSLAPPPSLQLTFILRLQHAQCVLCALCNHNCYTHILVLSRWAFSSVWKTHWHVVV